MENYQKGFLVDDDLLGGISVTQNPHTLTEEYLVFVLQYSTGEYLDAKTFSDIHSALVAINSVPRNWNYEPISGCDDNPCKKCKSDH